MWIQLHIRSDTLADLFRQGHVQVESLRPTAESDHAQVRNALLNSLCSDPTKSIDTQGGLPAHLSTAAFNQIAWAFCHAPNQETALQLHTAIMRYLDQLRDPCQRMQLKVLAHTLAQSYFQTPPRR